MKQLLILTFVCCLIAACAPPSPQVIQVSITATPDPSSTPEPTSTPSLASTARPTSTQLPTSTPTETLTPAEATKLSVAATGTAKAEERAAILTATAERAALLSEYERVNIQDFISFPAEFIGKKIVVMAEVDGIEGTGARQQVSLWLYSWAGSGFTTAWFNPPLTMDSGVREGHKYAVYGTPSRCPAGTWHELDGMCIADAFITGEEPAPVRQVDCGCNHCRNDGTCYKNDDTWQECLSTGKCYRNPYN